MIKSKLQHVFVPILVNRYFVHVYWGNKASALKSIRNHFDDRELNLDVSDCAGRTFTSDTYHPAIFINIPPSNPQFYGIVSHEAVHAVADIWRHIGEGSYDEAFAYSVEAIVSAVYEKVHKKSK